MTLSSFQAQPQCSHLEHVKCIYGYLYKLRNAQICMCTQELDYSDAPEEEYDLSKLVYTDISELVPKDAPVPLRRYVTVTHYIDTNLYHDMHIGHSITGILHFMNKTPMDWYSKKQATIETATCGSKFIVGHACVDQVVDLRLTLCYIREKSYMFGHNRATAPPSTTLSNTRCTMLCPFTMYMKLLPLSSSTLLSCTEGITQPTSWANTVATNRFGLCSTQSCFSMETQPSVMRMNSCLPCSFYPDEDMYVICNCLLEEDLELTGSDRICTALCTYGCMVCPLSTLYLFWVYLLEWNLSRRYISS